MVNVPVWYDLRFDSNLVTDYRGVEQGLARWAHNPKVGGSNPSPAIFKVLGGIAQSVEQRNHNPCVVGSSPAAAMHMLTF